MTVDLALEYIPRRMRELGYGDDYSLRFAHLVLQPNEVVNVEASCQFFILVEEPANISVESEMGIFNLALTTTNEQQYEHQGQVTVTNLAGAVNNVRFIQVIPKNNRKEK
jgi:hypothetical protein